MKKTMITLLVMVSMSMSSYAQYCYDYNIQMVFQNWQNWIWQQAPQPRWNMPSTVSSYDSETPSGITSRMRTRDVKCTNCSGRGYNNKTVYMGDGEYRTLQDRCNFCHGRGTVKETYCERRPALLTISNRYAKLL